MRALLAGLVLLAASTLPLAAHADTVDLFTLTGGGNTSTWTLPSVVNFTIPDGLGPFYATFPITIATNGVSSNSFVLFEEGNIVSLVVGGMQFINTPFLLDPTFVSDNGTVRSYTATFDSGTFSATTYIYPTGYVPYTLTIAAQQQVAATPEPSSLILLATGLLAAAPALRGGRRLPHS